MGNNHNNPLKPAKNHARDFHEEDKDWRLDAACTGLPTELWFPPSGSTNPDVLKVCHDCPVRLQCLAEALKEERGVHRTGRHGIRGGLSATGRAQLQQQLDGK